MSFSSQFCGTLFKLNTFGLWEVQPTVIPEGFVVSFSTEVIVTGASILIV